MISVAPAGSKRCNTCWKIKSLSEFRKLPKGVARRNRCKDCNSKIAIGQSRQKRLSIPGYVTKLTESHRRYLTTGRGYSSARITNARRRAKIKGLDFDLDVAWFEAKLGAGRCEISGLTFDYTDLALAPSIDRIDSRLGYTKSNCRVILYCLNAFKGSMDDEKCRQIARAFLNGTDL